MNANQDNFKKIISHAKEYGFIFQSSEIYDGLSAVYDYAQNGVELKNNIKKYWWASMVQMNDNIVGLDSSILMHPTTWKASRINSFFAVLAKFPHAIFLVFLISNPKPL